MLQHFPISEFLSGIHKVAIENLWHEFYQLYEILRKSSHTEEEILKFEKDAKNWVRTFCQPTINQKNSIIAISELYRNEDVMSYMHMLTIHILILCRN